MQEIEQKLGKAIIRVKTDDFDEMEKVCVELLIQFGPHSWVAGKCFQTLKQELKA